MKIILYLMVATSFLAADLFSVNIKIMELSIFRISLLMLTIFMLLSYLKTNKKIKLKLNNNRNKIIIFYLFWFIYSVFSVIWVKDYYYWVKAMFFIGSGLMCIWTLSTYVKKEKDFRSIFLIILSMLILHNIIGWSELITGVYRFTDFVRIDPHNQFVYNSAARIPISMFGNPNDYATVLVIGIFISSIIFSNSSNKLVKLFSISNIVSSILLVFRTNSRANLIGLIIGVIILIYMKCFKKISIKTLFVIIAIPILLLSQPHFIGKALSVVSDNLQFSFSGGGSDTIRLNLIRSGLHFLKETIGFGTGAGNIEYWMATKAEYNVAGITNMHNWWMEILVGYGVIIFIGYIMTYYKISKVLYYSHIHSKNTFIKNTSLGLLSSMVAFIFTSISSSSNISTEWLWVFWGVVIAYVGYVEKDLKLE